MNKTLKVLLSIVVGLILLAGAFSGGFIVGHYMPLASGFGGQPATQLPAVATPSSDQQGATPSELQTLFQPFWETWNLVHEQYVDQPVDDVALMRGAIEGMLATLGDEHTSFMDPKEFQQANESLSGEYEGIGAYVDTTADFLTVISPISGSPAEAAGLRPGDMIIAIDGEDMTGTDGELARQKVLGPAGSVVTLTIRRGEEAPFDVEITRAKITIKSSEGKMLENDIAYVKVSTFGDNTTPELLAALQELMAQNPKGLILDLRNNGGGYLDQGIAVSSAFMPKDQVVVLEKFGDGELKTYKSLGNGIVTDIPMVVLVNEGSASASEIVAGALQDYGRAKLVGTTTFGKGSVQSFIVLDNEQGAVGITVALWLTPKERSIDKTGLIPDIYVEFTQADLDADRDPQLDTAVETVLALLNKTPIPTSMPTTVPVP